MKTCPKMQKLIERIAARHEFDLTTRDPDQLGAVLKLVQPGYMPLYIAVIGINLVAVYHLRHDDYGDRIYDPEVVFFTGYPQWVPYSIWQPSTVFNVGGESFEVGGYREVARTSSDLASLTHADLPGMAEVGRFVENTWVPNLKAQGWLDAPRAQ